MKRRTRMELFAEEQPLLRPLPRHPYDTARVLYKLCDIAGFIAWEGNWYALPYEYVTEILPVRITESELFVYRADLTCIARHELKPRGAQQQSILPGHRPQHAERGPDLDQLRRAFKDLGDPAAAFLAALEKRVPRSAGYHARKVLALREGYDTADLLKALSHALSYGALEHDCVERILLARADCGYRSMPITDSGASRSLIPVEVDHCTHSQVTDRRRSPESCDFGAFAPEPVSSSRGKLPSPSSHRTGLVGLTSGSSGRRVPGTQSRYSGDGVATRS